MANDMQTLAAPVVSGATPHRRLQLIEVSVFLFLIVPSMLVSFFVTWPGRIRFVPVAVMTIFRDLALVSLILFFLWRNGETVQRIGWQFRKRGWDIVLGIVLFWPVFFGVGWLDSTLQSVGFSAPHTPQPAFLDVRGRAEGALALVMVLVVALAEETIFRGYLILRFRPLAASTTVAVVLSSVLFALGHGYEGTSGVVAVGTIGVILALIYVWRKSLVAPMVIHFLQDFVSILVLPLLAAR
jgi:membrane protease YdiL (CAAX protease family)